MVSKNALSDPLKGESTPTRGIGLPVCAPPGAGSASRSTVAIRTAEARIRKCTCTSCWLTTTTSLGTRDTSLPPAPGSMPGLPENVKHLTNRGHEEPTPHEDRHDRRLLGEGAARLRVEDLLRGPALHRHHP